MREWNIGDTGYLKEPYLSSGKQISVYEDELE